MAQSVLPEIGFVRLPQILQIIPVSKSTWWRGIQDGRFPKPVKLGIQSVGWPVEVIRALVEQLAAGQG